MTSLNHHFVPQFYLRNFATNRRLSEKPKLINLYNLKNNLFVENASIRKQCYRRRFYGETDQLEKMLAVFEYVNSILFSTIIKSERLPPKNSLEYSDLLFFTLLQQFRTKSQADMQNEMIHGLMKATVEDDERFKDFDFDSHKIGVKDPILLSMSALSPEAVKAIDDLEPNLILLGGQKRFIASDNPVVSYNQYFEWVKGMSNTGLVSKGLQMFFPLSPQCLLMLYDKNVYHALGQQNITHDISENDLQFINALQYINSDENIYFDSMSCRKDIEIIVKKYKSVKKIRKMNTLKFDEEQSSPSSRKSTLISTFMATPNIHLDLSFMKLTRAAKKVPARLRLNDRFRKEFDPLNLMGKGGAEYTPPIETGTRFVLRKSKDERS